MAGDGSLNVDTCANSSAHSTLRTRTTPLSCSKMHQHLECVQRGRAWVIASTEVASVSGNQPIVYACTHTQLPILCSAAAGPTCAALLAWDCKCLRACASLSVGRRVFCVHVGTRSDTAEQKQLWG